MERNKSIIIQAKRLGIVGKHAGSKPIRKLTRAMGQIASHYYWEEKAKEALSNS